MKMDVNIFILGKSLIETETEITHLEQMALKQEKQSLSLELKSQEKLSLYVNYQQSHKTKE